MNNVSSSHKKCSYVSLLHTSVFLEKQFQLWVFLSVNSIIRNICSWSAQPLWTAQKQSFPLPCPTKKKKRTPNEFTSAKKVEIGVKVSFRFYLFLLMIFKASVLAFPFRFLFFSFSNVPTFSLTHLSRVSHVFLTCHTRVSHTSLACLPLSVCLIRSLNPLCGSNSWSC